MSSWDLWSWKLDNYLWNTGYLLTYLAHLDIDDSSYLSYLSFLYTSSTCCLIYSFSQNVNSTLLKSVMSRYFHCNFHRYLNWSELFWDFTEELLSFYGYSSGAISDKMIFIIFVLVSSRILILIYWRLLISSYICIDKIFRTTKWTGCFLM
jgi:hypothetical protein